MSNPTKLDPHTPGGRTARDERGKAAWELPSETGSFRADLGSYNPYSSADTPMEPKAPRRTLDDMRRLSEEIKRARELRQT